MKFTEPRPYAEPENAARRVMELAHAVEPVQDGRIHIEKINGPFLFKDKGSPAEYGAGTKRDSKRTFVINKDHIPKLIELGLVELRDDQVPSLTLAGKTIAWDH